MTASIKKLAIAMLPLLFYQTEVQAHDNMTGQSKIDRSTRATDVPTWESLKPEKQVAPIDHTQPVITPQPSNKERLPTSGADGRMQKQQVAPIDDAQPIFTPHPTRGRKQ